jgi:membrane peptidoglycan carboxypeptidase
MRHLQCPVVDVITLATAAWSPAIPDNQYRGMITLKKSPNSVNTVSAKLMDKSRSRSCRKTHHKLGIKSKFLSSPHCFGAVDITVVDMVAAYSTLQIKECTLKTAVLSSIEDKKVINYL